MQNHEIRQKLRETNFAGLETVKIVLKSGDIVDIEDIVFSHLDGGMIQIIAGQTEDELEEKERAEEQNEIGCPPGCTSPICSCPGND